MVVTCMISRLRETIFIGEIYIHYFYHILIDIQNSSATHHIFAKCNRENELPVQRERKRDIESPKDTNIMNTLGCAEVEEKHS